MGNLRLWCNRSKPKNGGIEAGVVWEKDGTKEEWQEQKVGLDLNKEIFNAEM